MRATKHDPKLALVARGWLSETLTRLMRRQAAEARSAAKSPNDFVGKMDRFFERFADKMVEELTPATEACRAAGLEFDVTERAKTHCETSLAAVLEIAGRSKMADIAETINAEADRWEKDLAARLADQWVLEDSTDG
jgi:hypothetical protein